MNWNINETKINANQRNSKEINQWLRIIFILLRSLEIWHFKRSKAFISFSYWFLSVGKENVWKRKMLWCIESTFSSQRKRILEALLREFSHYKILKGLQCHSDWAVWSRTQNFWLRTLHICSLLLHYHWNQKAINCSRILLIKCLMWHDIF